MTEQRRAHPRAPVALTVVYQRMNAFIADYARNISKGGIFVESENPFDPGTVFDFHLSLPGQEEPLRLRGKVKWVSKGTKEGLLGMGIEFIWEGVDRTQFEAAVESVIVESLGQAVYDKLRETV